VQRSVPEVVSAEIAGPQVADLKIQGCLEKAACQNELTRLFGEGIFITGDINLPEIKSGAQGVEKDGFLTLYLFNSRTKETATFQTRMLMKATDTELEILRDMIRDAFFEKGFIFHVRSLL
jgi:hypothetical protein